MRQRDLRRSIISAVGKSPDTANAGEEPNAIKPAGTGSGESMRLILWEDIWTSLRVARLRGNSDMIDVFYDTLFREAVFDDAGAWALDPKKR